MYVLELSLLRKTGRTQPVENGDPGNMIVL